VYACIPEDEVFTDDFTLKLEYSTDTVNFDTIITDLPSITKRFKIYNPHKNAINIASIRLEGSNSPYFLSIHGEQANNYNNIRILGGDSLLVLVNSEIATQNSDASFTIVDAVSVEYHSYQDRIILLTVGTDAKFLNSSVICDEVWSAGSPYFINELILVDSLCTLTINAGSRVLMGNGAAIFVKGTLIIAGTAELPVTIRNARLDQSLESVAGQWDAIYFLEGSKNNKIDHAQIKNGTIGLRVGSPDADEDYDLVVSNTKVQNMSLAGILAFSSDIYGYNLQINNCKNYLIGNFAGGNYTYQHCTMSNFPTDFFRQDPSVQFSDVLFLDNNTSISAPLKVQIQNSILWGNESETLLTSNAGNQPFEITLENNILKSSDQKWVTNGNRISQDRTFPGFVAPLSGNFKLDSLSKAVNTGKKLGILQDLNGVKRDSLPDIGAYERVPKK
jgi:hypothetical protein